MKCPSNILLCSLLALFLRVNASLATDTCVIKAWVRAPDLDPGEIIPGQARIRTKGPCSPISEYSLILRFEERMMVKILKPDVVIPEEPSWPGLYLNFMRTWDSDDPQWDAYRRKLNDPSLWTIADQKRVAFETRYKLFDGSTPKSEIQSESIHDFALLVPTTNYPPGDVEFKSSLATNDFKSARGNEHIYLYTVEIKFVNGTILEIPAGRSSFNVVGQNSESNSTPEVVTFATHFKEISRTELVQPWTPMNISFDVDATFPSGRRLEQGSTLDLTFTINGEPQISSNVSLPGYSIVLGAPSLDLRPTSTYHRMETFLPGMMNVSADIPPSRDLSRCQLSPTSNDDERFEPCFKADSIRLGHVFRKPQWNKATSVSYEIPKMALPSFNMYYQSIEAKIVITLNLEYTQTLDPLLADEDYAWIPTLPTPRALEITRYFSYFRAEIPVTVYPQARKHYAVTHYLHPEARQPIFVDPIQVNELLRLSVGERDLLAPECEYVISENTNCDGVAIDGFPHYVGDTWQRKVFG